jgi:hypothetical protein
MMKQPAELMVRLNARWQEVAKPIAQALAFLDIQEF